MHLSSLQIDVGESGGDSTIGSKWLANRYRVHQRLCMAFPKAERLIADPDFLAPFTPTDFPALRADATKSKTALGVEPLAQVHTARTATEGFLFRIDRRPRGFQVLVQSATEPNWKYAFANFHGVLVTEPQVRSFAPSFRAGQRLQFRLEANPTRKIDTKTGPDGLRHHGKRVPVAGDKCLDWLCQFEKVAGFTLDAESVVLDCSFTRVRKGADGDSATQYLAARFDGLLTVTDPAAFLAKLAAGFGSAKAYGFGLMSVAAAAR